MSYFTCHCQIMSSTDKNKLSQKDKSKHTLVRVNTSYLGFPECITYTDEHFSVFVFKGAFLHVLFDSKSHTCSLQKTWEIQRSTNIPYAHRSLLANLQNCRSFLNLTSVFLQCVKLSPQLISLVTGTDYQSWSQMLASWPLFLFFFLSFLPLKIHFYPPKQGPHLHIVLHWALSMVAFGHSFPFLLFNCSISNVKKKCQSIACRLAFKLVGDLWGKGHFKFKSIKGNCGSVTASEIMILICQNELLSEE